jgi:hypothetical protein
MFSDTYDPRPSTLTLDSRPDILVTMLAAEGVLEIMHMGGLGCGLG